LPAVVWAPAQPDPICAVIEENDKVKRGKTSSEEESIYKPRDNDITALLTRNIPELVYIKPEYPNTWSDHLKWMHRKQCPLGRV
jgi:hypothetical protein